MKPNSNSVEVHPRELSHNGHPVDGGAGGFSFNVAHIVVESRWRNSVHKRTIQNKRTMAHGHTWCKVSPGKT